MKNSYYLGLDIGTESVGWAVTDNNYNLYKSKGKELWGIRLFEAGKTALDRRISRSARRRNKRKTQRIRLLQELFSAEISKLDQGFYYRLKDSFFLMEDKKELQTNTLFNDSNYKDIDYHKQYPTIYHLRKDLIEKEHKKFDIRLIYLGIAHILKKRGHFLFPDKDINVTESLSTTFFQFSKTLKKTLEIDFYEHINPVEFEEIMKERIGINAKTYKLNGLCLNNDKSEHIEDIKLKQMKSFIKLLSGAKVKLYDLFQLEELKDIEKSDVCFSKSGYEDNYGSYCSVLQDKIVCIDDSKTLYDMSLLANILKDTLYLSYAKDKSFHKHKEDLRKFKDLIKEHCSLEKYKEMFVDVTMPNNYCAYIGKWTKINNKSTCTQEDFYSYTKKILKDIDIGIAECKFILEEIENNNFLPKQTSGENSVIPYQLNMKELEKILENASKHYPFLQKKDEQGLSITDKIISIMQFRIPYYIGPLNDFHKKNEGRSNCWIVKKETGSIYPWNFEQKVDIDKSAEEFIKQMTNKCTYLIGADVLPKHSILYSKFVVLNELNNLKINGNSINVSLKQDIYNDLFLKYTTVTQKKLKYYLISQGIMLKGDDISGIDGDFKGSMKSLIEIKNILQEKANDNNLCEDIIKNITLFGEEKKLTKKRMQAYPSLSIDEIKGLVKLKYSGWGRFSKEFLTEIDGFNISTGEISNIISAMYNSNNNLMQLLSSSYTYLENIEKYNIAENTTEIPYTYEYIVAPLYCSPAVKRGIWQTLNIVKELTKTMGSEPKKIFIEVAREEGKKVRTKSRKDALKKLYTKCKDDSKHLLSSLENKTDAELRSKKLYLYYTQLGKCMYSGENISLDNLLEKKTYDIDHIIPQSKTKDDSFDNIALVCREYNQRKGDNYPVPPSFQTKKVIDFWRLLAEKGLISTKKFSKLMRIEELTPEDLAGFINRQLVETRQSSKAVAEILQKTFTSRVVYSKAGNVTDFRKEFKLIKVRELNDLHHAEDAYLNIVVGNAYDTKFTTSPINFIKEKIKYNLNRMYEYDIERKGINAWKTGDNGTISIVKNTLDKKRILFTRYATEITGEFFNQQPLKKSSDKPHNKFPLKPSDERVSVEKYGYYDNVSSAYFILVKHIHKKKEIRSIEYVPIHLAKIIKNEALSLEDYCIKYLKLHSPTILLRKIKKWTLFKINGFPMHITGRQSDSIIFSPAVQFHICEESKCYFKNVIAFNMKEKQKKNDNISEEELLSGKIDAENNIKMYNILLEKFNTTIYKHREKNSHIALEKGKDIFADLKENVQVDLLYNALNLFQCRAITANLELIGGKKNGGKLTKSKVLKKEENPRIIYQSPTGLFEQEIDLFSL